MRKLSAPQQLLLDEIREAGILYVKTYGQYGRTVRALERLGLVVVVAPDYSRLQMPGYSVAKPNGYS